MSSSSNPVAREAARAASAIGFLTLLPLPGRHSEAPAAGAHWFPVAGALVGGSAAATLVLTDDLFGSYVASVLAVVVLVAMAGALHQDGLADCADALGAYGDRARRLEIMRDPNVGTFGLLALLAYALLLTGAVASMDADDAWPALLATGFISRTAALLHASVLAPARADGLGAAFVVPAASMAVANVATLIGAYFVDAPERGLASLAAALVAVGAVTLWAKARVGGRTGDTIGAAVALTEVAVVLTFLGFA